MHFLETSPVTTTNFQKPDSTAEDIAETQLKTAKQKIDLADLASGAERRDIGKLIAECGRQGNRKCKGKRHWKANMKQT